MEIGHRLCKIIRACPLIVLERHHPDFFDLRKAKGKNTPLLSEWSLQDVETAIFAVINQNRAKLIKAGSGAKRGQFEGVYQGKRFMLGIKSGKIGQFTPLD